MVEDAEMIARLIGRCNIFQNIYLHRKLLASKELEEALIRLYAMMILYLSKAKRFFEQTSVKRIFKKCDCQSRRVRKNLAEHNR